LAAIKLQSQFARARRRRMPPSASRLWHQPCSAIAILDDYFRLCAAKLSREIQKAMVDAAEEIIPSACQEVQKTDNETKKSMETAGIRFETYLDSLIDDPHLTSVGLIQSVEHPTEGRCAWPARPRPGARPRRQSGITRRD